MFCWWEPEDQALKAVAKKGTDQNNPLSGAHAQDTGEGTRYGRRPKRSEKTHIDAPKKPQQ
jgi:hypothetical protein